MSPAWRSGDAGSGAEPSTAAGHPEDPGDGRWHGSRARRVGVGIADQAVSSIGNFGLALLVARGVDARGFGAFGVAFGVYALAVGVSRALSSEPLTVRYSASSQSARRAAAAAATGTSLVVGFVLAALAGTAGVVIGGQLGQALLPMALFLPALLLQDAWRSVFFTEGRPCRALANDCIWTGTLFALASGLSATGHSSLTLLVAVWGVAAAVSAGVASMQARLLPRPAAAGAWLRHHRDLWPRFTTEFVVMTGTWQLAILALGVIAGLSAVGAVRGAQTILGPLNLLFLAAPLVIVPEVTRLSARGPEKVVSSATTIGLVLCAVAAAYGTMVLLVPDGLGAAVLGDSWAPARDVIVPMVFFVASTGVNIAAIAGLRSLAAARTSFRARLAVSPLLIIGGVVGALLGGATGAALGLAVTNWMATLVWWRALTSASSRLASGTGSS